MLAGTARLCAKGVGAWVSAWRISYSRWTAGVQRAVGEIGRECFAGALGTSEAEEAFFGCVSPRQVFRLSGISRSNEPSEVSSDKNEAHFRGSLLRPQ